ncbi:MAG: dTMP kinase [Patescibacteria group bacterium]|jgi:dTMP kinase
MNKHGFPGLFIAFEGLDGSGSSTQVDLLTKKLNKLGYFAFDTKEPTNNLIGGLIRGALTQDWKASPECLQLLFAADRAHHLQREIVPSLEKGNIIISDRYYYSSIALGSVGCERKWLAEINGQFISPDIVFLIKVKPSECINRIARSRNEFELFEEEKKLGIAWDTYAWLHRRRKDPIVLIDGERKIEQIEMDIWAYLQKVLESKGSLRLRKKQSAAIAVSK